MKRRPTHPGDLLKLDVLPAMDVTQEEFAQMLGLSRKTVNEILAAKSPVRAETAIKLGTLLGNSPQFWMNLQAGFDLWEADQSLSADTLKHLAVLRRNIAARG